MCKLIKSYLIAKSIGSLNNNEWWEYLYALVFIEDKNFFERGITKLKMAEIEQNGQCIDKKNIFIVDEKFAFHLDTNKEKTQLLFDPT